METYKTIKLKRLYGNVASVRDYIWKKIIADKKGIIFECNGAKMKIEPWEVSQGDVNKEAFTSRFDNKQYRLVDFKWRTNEKNLFS